MTLTEKALRGGVTAAHGQSIVKEGEVTGISPTGAEIMAIGPVNVRGMRRKTFFYRNRSVSKTATIKVYASPYRVIPTAINDTIWKQIGANVSVSAGTMSEPLMYEGDYHWMMMTVTADAESDKGDAYLTCTHD